MNDKQLYIKTIVDTDRFTYVLDFIFNTCYKVDYKFISNLNDIPDDALILCYGGTDTIKHTMSVPESGILSSKGYEDEYLFDNFELSFEEKQDQLVANFDLFGCIFYHLSRYEEYGSSPRDEFGRFCGKDAVAKERIREPYLDLLIQQFIDKLSSFWNMNFAPKTSYSFTHTLDIDQFYAYRAKPIPRVLGGFAKDLLSLNFQRLKERFSAEDPYDTYEKLTKKLKTSNQHVFILQSRDSKFDIASDIQDTAVIDQIKKIALNAELGIHPGFETSKSQAKIKDEIGYLESLTTKKVIQSRQHYLNLQFPQTYRNLLETGILRDFTLGYHDEIGFRSGTTHTFYWYDLEEEKVTKLEVVPFQVMDVTLKKYLKLDPNEAIAATKSIIDACKKVNGNFCLLWHNSSFSASEGWKAWDRVYEEIISYADLD